MIYELILLISFLNEPKLILCTQLNGYKFCFVSLRGCPRGVMVNAMDCESVVSEFELQSHYYVHFRKNTLRKGMNSLILPDMG